MIDETTDRATSLLTDKTIDGTTSHLTGETTSQSTKPPKNGGKAAGYRSRFLVALILGITFSLPAAAKLYKWVDDNGVTHYGEVIPPEFANKDRVELDKSGRVVKTEEVLTPEKRLAKEKADAKKHEEEQAAIEQQRRDKTLVNTYNNVKEIDQARGRSLQQIDAHINVINSSIKAANDNLAGLKKEADGYTKRNKDIPDSLKDDLQNAQARLDKLNKDLEKPLADKATVEARYNADKARYIELTGKN
ncbi:MAG: DUF4124 domain-containing protein [Gallionella sp.]